MVLLAQISTFILTFALVVGMLIQFMRIRSTQMTNTILIGIFFVGMVLIAYSTWLGTGSDISRYYMILNGMRGKSFSWAMENGVYKETIITNAFLWLIAQTGNNQLLPAASTGLILLNIIYLIRQESKRDTLELSTQLTYLILYFAIATFSAVMTGVRQNWMVSTFAIAVYRDVVQKKRGIPTILLYAAACLIHNSALLLVAVRLASLVRGWLRYLFLGWGFLIPYAEQYKELEGIFGEAAEKLSGYQGVNDFDIRLLIAKTAVMALLFVALLMLRKKEKGNRYYEFMEMLIIFTVSASGVQHVYSRLINAVAVCSLPLLADFRRQAKDNVWFLFLLALTVLCLGLFAYQLTTILNYWQFRDFS